MPDRLDENKILKNIEKLGSKCVSRLVFFDETESTNSVAKRLAREGAPDCTVVAARRQSAGRGRLGRSFLSEEGGIYLSYIIRPDCEFSSALKITAGAAVAVMRAVKSYCDNVLIKWVNDVYINGKKVCGILSEASPDAENGVGFIVVGVGVNVFGSAKDFGDELSDIVTTIEENSKKDIDINELFAKIIFELNGVYKSLGNFKSVISQYRENSLVIGKKVYITEGGKSEAVKVIDVDESGALVVCDEFSKMRKISGGEVSLRVAKRKRDGFSAN